MQPIIRVLQADRKNKSFKILFGFYVLFLLVATLLPVNIIQSESISWFSKLTFQNGDKVMHFIFFFGFTVLFHLSNYVKRGPVLWVTAAAIGMLIEILQEIMGLGRTFEWMDFATDLLGALTAYYLIVKRL